MIHPKSCTFVQTSSLARSLARTETNIDTRTKAGTHAQTSRLARPIYTRPLLHSPAALRRRPRRGCEVLARLWQRLREGPPDAPHVLRQGAVLTMGFMHSFMLPQLQAAGLERLSPAAFPTSAPGPLPALARGGMGGCRGAGGGRRRAGRGAAPLGAGAELLDDSGGVLFDVRACGGVGVL